MRLRWDELTPTERRNFASTAVNLMSEIANPCEEWALKSQTAALVAEVLHYSLFDFRQVFASFLVVNAHLFHFFADGSERRLKFMAGTSSNNNSLL